MTSTAATPGEYDALEKARPDEPLFTLLARDPAAPATVRFWVDRRRAALMDELGECTSKAGHFPAPEGIRAELSKLTEAEMVAFEMDRWRKGQPEHDTTTPKRASYSDNGPEVQSEETARKHAVALSAADLGEAAYFANEARQRLTEYGAIEPELAAQLEVIVTQLVAAQDAVTPKRPNYQPQEVLPLLDPGS